MQNAMLVLPIDYTCHAMDLVDFRLGKSNEEYRTDFKSRGCGQIERCSLDPALLVITSRCAQRVAHLATGDSNLDF